MHKRLWRVRIDPKRPAQSRVWYKGEQVYPLTVTAEQGGHDIPTVTLVFVGTRWDIDWLTEEESDALQAESQEQEAGTGEEGD